MSKSRPFLLSLSLALVVSVLSPETARAQDASGVPVFKSQVNLVSLAAVVRDKKGRVVSSLTARDFEVRENGQVVPILDVRSEKDAPANVALLVDGSGSMTVGDSFGLARQVSERILRSLDRGRDEAALYSFDTRVLTLQTFTPDLSRVEHALQYLESWGSTSLYDAIGGVAGKIHERAESRRAIVVFTDGQDTTSTLPPSEVATLTSALDVPVYAFVLNPLPVGDPKTAAHNSALEEIAHATGGMYFVATDAVTLAAQVETLLEELRSQHVVAFEASKAQGWRSLELSVRRKGYSIRSRGWYWSGDDAPTISQRR